MRRRTCAGAHAQAHVRRRICPAQQGAAVQELSAWRGRWGRGLPRRTRHCAAHGSWSKRPLTPSCALNSRAWRHRPPCAPHRVAPPLPPGVAAGTHSSTLVARGGTRTGPISSPSSVPIPRGVRCRERVTCGPGSIAPIGPRARGSACHGLRPRRRRRRWPGRPRRAEPPCCTQRCDARQHESSASPRSVRRRATCLNGWGARAGTAHRHARAFGAQRGRSGSHRSRERRRRRRRRRPTNHSPRASRGSTRPWATARTPHASASYTICPGARRESARGKIGCIRDSGAMTTTA